MLWGLSMSNTSKTGKCYMCGGANEGREHVPARTCHPPGYREQPWTVPACTKHNQANSKDVEYVAGCIISAIESTGVALDESQKKFSGHSGIAKAYCSVLFGTLDPKS